MYHLNHFQVCGSVPLSAFTLCVTVTTVHPQNSFHLAELKLCTCSSVTPIPCPQPGSSLSTLCLYEYDTLRTSCKWNHTVCVLL